MIDQLKRHEGYRRHMYLCPAGYPTIGFGTRIDGKGQGVSPSAAEDMLIEAVNDIDHDLARFQWYRSLNQTRRATVINMAYQLGIGGLLNFKRMIDALRSEDFEKASEEMLDSKWARQTPGRAQELALQMRKGYVGEDGSGTA